MKLYRELTHWWQLFSPVEEYADEAMSFLKILKENSSADCRTILELGAGAGSVAFYLKKEFAMTLTDISPEMLNVSRALNPECEHLLGDMRSVRLNRRFDAVFIHDAIMYLTTVEDLRQTIETAYLHCKPGGALVVAPDYVRETFKPSTEHGGGDEKSGVGNKERDMRWLMWTFDPDPDDTVVEVHFAFLLKEGAVLKVEQDRHLEGLFARAEWLRIFEEAGFSSTKIIVDLYGREIFVARKPERTE